MKKFSLIFYLAKLLLYIILSLLLSFGSLAVLGSFLGWNYGINLTMTLLASFAFYIGFWNFFFFISHTAHTAGPYTQ